MKKGGFWGCTSDKCGNVVSPIPSPRQPVTKSPSSRSLSSRPQSPKASVTRPSSSSKQSTRPPALKKNPSYTEKNQHINQMMGYYGYN